MLKGESRCACEILKYSQFLEVDSVTLKGSLVKILKFLAAPLAPSISLRHLLFGFSSDELTVVPRVFVYLLFDLKYCIWSQRNDFCFNSVTSSAIGLLASVKARVRFHLPLFFKRFRSLRRRRYFLRQWGANGVICSIRNSSLAFNM